MCLSYKLKILYLKIKNVNILSRYFLITYKHLIKMNISLKIMFPINYSGNDNKFRIRNDTCDSGATFLLKTCFPYSQHHHLLCIFSSNSTLFDKNCTGGVDLLFLNSDKSIVRKIDFVLFIFYRLGLRGCTTAVLNVDCHCWSALPTAQL